MSRFISNEEEVISEFSRICEKRGYSQYRMNKFEEYDLYVRNKDFLVSDSVITFTDTSGKLMALKPDVTLSIIKNGKDIPGEIQKVYYNESVYRVSKHTHSFREITQVGLEAIGAVDEYTIYEVLRLACESLGAISQEYVLDISELDIIGKTVDMLGVSPEQRTTILKCIGEKNTHEIRRICKDAGADSGVSEMLISLIGCECSPEETVRRIRSFPEAESFSAELDRLGRIAALLSRSGFGNRVFIDFSVINDMNYYSGIAFSGFVPGIPGSILSGGQYDRLMKKMNRRSSAIGFAVYLDMLELLGASPDFTDADNVLIYDESTPPQKLMDAAESLGADGSRVLVLKKIPAGLRFRRLAQLTESGVIFRD